MGFNPYANKPPKQSKEGEAKETKPRKAPRRPRPEVHGPLYTKKEAAAYLGLSVRKIEYLVTEKKLRKMRKISRVLFPQSGRDRFIEANF